MFSRRFASTTVDPAAVKKGLEAVGGRLQRKSGALVVVGVKVSVAIVMVSLVDTLGFF